MYTISQIQNATLEQVRNDPELLRTIARLNNPSVSPQTMLNYWESNQRNFNADRSYAVDQAQWVTSELWRNLDRYGNWNDPNHPNDYRAALRQREIGLQTLDEWKQRLTNLGVDWSTVTGLVNAYSSFGATPGGGVTSQQAAQNPDFAHGNNGQPIQPNTQNNETTTTTTTNSNTTSNPPISSTTNNQGGYVYSDQFLNSKANNAAVNQLYQSYFGRNATQAELNNWGANGGPDTTVRALEDFLKQERIRYNVTTPITPIPTSNGGSGTVPNTTNNTTTNNTTNNNTTTTNNIPFKDGLTQAQKDSITALAQKPFDQWNQGDKDNWNYATNNAPFPNGGGGSSGNNTTTTNNNNGTVNSADQKWINDLYQKYFDRTATSAEINNWLSANPQALEQFLAAEQKKYGYVSTAMGAERKARYDAAMKIINESNLPEEIKALWRNTVGLYPDATDFKPQEILDTFNKIKTETIDPYFKELSDVAINDLKTSFASLQDNRAMELETERANAGESIRQAKAGLEKSGMTFTGQGIENLGASSAYAQNNTDGTSATPTQIPFAGLNNVFYEGKVNQANRLLSSSSAARYSLAQQNLGRQAESLIGSTGVMNALPGLEYTPSGTNLTGQYQTQKDARYGSTLEQILQNWRSSQKLSTNI